MTSLCIFIVNFEDFMFFSSICTVESEQVSWLTYFTFNEHRMFSQTWAFSLRHREIKLIQLSKKFLFELKWKQQSWQMEQNREIQ